MKIWFNIFTLIKHKRLIYLTKYSGSTELNKRQSVPILWGKSLLIIIKVCAIISRSFSCQNL